MHTSSTIKTLLVFGLALFIIACNSSSEKKKKEKEKIVDTTVGNASSASEPPVIKIDQPIKKCFSNDGLQYRTIVTMKLIGDQVLGMVTTEELESHKKETADFEGSVSNNQLTIKFKATPPPFGKASEWTTRPWSLDTKTGKETLRIIFNAKNYETNKWAETVYEFALADCK